MLFRSITYKDALKVVDDTLNTTRLATILGVPFSPDSYDQYIVLAERFFLTIVRLIKTIWPDKYHNLGYSYTYRAKRETFVTLRPKPEESTEISRMHVDVRGEEITNEMVARNEELRAMRGRV